MKGVCINEKFEKLLPPLSEEDYKTLENSLTRYGRYRDDLFSKIKLWHPEGEDVLYIVDGHNRYRICQKHNIKLEAWCFEFVHFESEEEVILWMYENQLARRNLSPIDKVAMAEKFADSLKEKAKKNQSDGGKGKANLPKVNVREELAKKVGVSERQYDKLKKIKESGNEEVIEAIRNNEMSVDRGYKAVTQKKVEQPTSEQRIAEIDNQLREIDKKMDSLKNEKKRLVQKRKGAFEELDVKCELKYRFVGLEDCPEVKNCEFYIEYEGREERIARFYVTDEDSVWEYFKNEVPEKYKCDFDMLREKVCREQEELEKKRRAESDEKIKHTFEKVLEAIFPTVTEEEKAFYKKCYLQLAKSFHPDNGGTDEDMQQLVKLKAMWGV